MLNASLLQTRRRWLGQGLGLCLSAAGPFATSSVASAQVQAPVLPDAASAQARLEQLLADQVADPQGPGLAVLVARGDELLAQAARGMASVELEVPLTTAHRFKIASITKQVSAALLLKLVDEGRAQLSDPLTKHLPDYPGGKSITLDMLLNHTAGVASHSALPGYLGNPIRRDLDTARLVDEFRFLPAEFPPGTGWAYSNGGYVLVGAVIEKITGRPWWEAAGRLPAPLLYPAPDRLVPGLAQGYSRAPAGHVRPAALLSMTQAHAASGLVGDLRALWHWNRLLHETGWLSASSHRRMTTPEGAAATQRYGFGLLVATLRGKPLWLHGGIVHGFTTLLSYQPADRITVALLRNSDAAGPDLDGLARELGALAAGRPFPDPPPVDADPSTWRALEGLYGRGDQQRTIRVVDGRLVSQRTGQRVFALQPVGAARFRFPGSPTQLEFIRSEDGRVIGLRMHPEGDGEGELHIRVSDLPATGR